MVVVFIARMYRECDTSATISFLQCSMSPPTKAMTLPVSGEIGWPNPGVHPGAYAGVYPGASMGTNPGMRNVVPASMPDPKAARRRRAPGESNSLLQALAVGMQGFKGLKATAS